MEENKKSKRVVGIVATITVLILGIIGYIVYDNFLKVDKTAPNYDNSNTTTTKKTFIETNEDIKYNELVNLLKDFYINQEPREGITDFYDDDNVESWNIDNIKYLGYYANEENIKYYVATGNFKCKDNGATCIYIEQLDDVITNTIPFKAVFAIKQTKNKYEFDHMESSIFDDLVKGDPESSNGFVLIDKFVKSIDNKQETNNIVNKIKALPKENDSSVLWEGDIYNLTREYIDFNTNFKNIEKTENGFNLSYSCVLYDENNRDESIDKCTKFKIDIAEKDNNIFADFYYGLKLIFTDSYIIAYEGGYAGNLRIFDKSGKEVFKEYIGTDFIIKTDEDTYNTEIEGYRPTIKDNKLYFVKYENNDKQNFIVSSYDFNTHKMEEIMEFEAEIGIY